MKKQQILPRELLALDILDEWRRSLSVSHWPRKDIEDFVEKCVDLAALVLEDEEFSPEKTQLQLENMN